jgi:hypothetical protein
VGHDIVEMAAFMRHRGPDSTAVTQEAGSDIAVDPKWDDTTHQHVLVVRAEIQDVGDLAATFPAIDPRPADVQVLMTTHAPDDGFVLGPLPGAEQVTVMAGFSARGFKLAMEGESPYDLDRLRVERFSTEPRRDAEEPAASLTRGPDP